MAADQRKKRFDSASILGPSGDLYKVRRKKLGLSQCGLDMRSNISLKWDDSRKSVVAKREQIGISRRELIPFVDAVVPGQNILADVIAVPREIFRLDNLANVLTYEVWQTYLSETERSLLTQFLPKCSDPDGLVQELLGGDDFNFGNPFLNWGTLLCSGNSHPDNILYHEQCLRASKKAYYSDLQKYHTDMIENLQTWKERFASCKNSEGDFIQRIWRSRKNAKKRICTSEPGSHDLEENIFTTPESSCRVASEKAYSSDNADGILLHREMHRRKGSTSSKFDNSSDGLKGVSKHWKGEKLLKRNIQHGDGGKYMSYIKVSKAQHQRVKSSMKQNSSSIQPKSLHSVLGNINALHVRPFEVYEEEERQKLHEHWLQLANRDLPACVAHWRNMQSQRLQITKSLGQEMEGKLKSSKESISQNMEENFCDMQVELLDNEEADAASTINKESEVSPPILEEEAPTMAGEEAPTMAGEEAPVMNLEDDEQSDGSIDDQTENVSRDGGVLAFVDKEIEKTVGDADNSVSVSMQNEHVHQISLSNSCNHYDGVNVETHGDLSDQTTDKASPDGPEYPASLNHVDAPMNHEDSLASAVDSWQQVGMPGSYYHSTSLNHGYSSANELSLGYHQVQPSQLMNLEALSGEKIANKDILRRHSGDISLFSPYPNQDRNELFRSFYKGESNSPYQHEQKQTGLDFQPTGNLTVEAGQFPGHMREQVHSSLPLELRQKSLGDFYLHRNIQESMYSDGERYPNQRQENLPLNVQDWGVNNVHMAAPAQSHMNGFELLNQNWFSGENQARGSWSCMEGAVGPSQSIGSGSSSDQSLFSVLSECNELRSGARYDSLSSSGRLMQSGGSYGGGSGGVHTSSNLLPQTTSSLATYLSGHEAAPVGYKSSSSSLGWMSMQQHQTPGLEEAMGKPPPFLRPWNQ